MRFIFSEPEFSNACKNALAFFQRNNPRTPRSEPTKRSKEALDISTPCSAAVCDVSRRPGVGVRCRCVARLPAASRSALAGELEAGNGGCLPDAMIGKLQQYRLPVGSRMLTVVGKSRGSSGDPHRRVLKTKAAPTSGHWKIGHHDHFV